mmetsp:Transcript_38029/g.104608  ORF Transcript_38029/g.104608 Transcript_38029/m.104608 type:complete len:226 (+) Transcript_38029:150-827(+)|eukprot:CAMPEP_0117570828 /NCGR_PEP_ID=MMETSP0784-20121206/59408_1 /TAXON_ID=39447 /ORGANISM="" /LENGTH=225 /DNA_ID=CAMNT_0005368911 /DNA_START=87 /DNA_END=764 /DNA_ORIENTATION=+
MSTSQMALSWKPRPEQAATLSKKPVTPNIVDGETWYDEELASSHAEGHGQKIALFQVTIHLPLEVRPLPMLGLMFSFIPFMLPFIILVAGHLNGRTLQGLYGVGLALFCIFVSEVLLKPLLRQPRPRTTASREEDGTPTNGMPSGHTLSSQTLCMWLMLEIHVMQNQRFVKDVTFALLVLMGGTPWGRWYNGDHSLGQVLVSVALGTLFGVVAFLFEPEWLQRAQ